MAEKILFTYEKFPQPVEVFSLDDEMNKALYEFFGRFIDEPDIRYHIISERLFAGFELEICNYLDRRYSSGNPDTFSKQDYLFNNLTLVSNNYTKFKLYNDVQLFWKRIYEIVTNWEKNRNSRVHKGSLFFFWSAGALLNGELDKGFFLIHEAFREDKITSGNENPETPAQKTARLNFKDAGNFLYLYVLELWKFIDSAIVNYNNDNSRNISREDIFTKFTSCPPSDDVLFSFAHTIAKLDELNKLETGTISSDFAGLYQLNLLFDLILVIDNLIFSKVTPPKDRKKWMFFGIAKKLLLDSKIEISEDNCVKNLGSINGSQTLDFDKTITELLDMSFKFPAMTNISSLYRDICICYCIRNHSAHNISLTSTISNHFKEISQSVMNVLFLCIETY